MHEGLKNMDDGLNRIFESVQGVVEERQAKKAKDEQEKKDLHHKMLLQSWPISSTLRALASVSGKMLEAREESGGHDDPITITLRLRTPRALSSGGEPLRHEGGTEKFSLSIVFLTKNPTGYSVDPYMVIQPYYSDSFRYDNTKEWQPTFTGAINLDKACDEVSDFLKRVLTPEEFEKLAKRLQKKLQSAPAPQKAPG